MMPEHHPDPFGDALQQGVQRAIQLGSGAVTAAQVGRFRERFCMRPRRSPLSVKRAPHELADDDGGRIRDQLLGLRVKLELGHELDHFVVALGARRLVELVERAT